MDEEVSKEKTKPKLSYFDDCSWRERNSCCFLDPCYQNWEAGGNMTDWKYLFWVCNYPIQAIFPVLSWYQTDPQGKKYICIEKF